MFSRSGLDAAPSRAEERREVLVESEGENLGKTLGEALEQGEEEQKQPTTASLVPGGRVRSGHNRPFSPDRLAMSQWLLFAADFVVHLVLNWIVLGPHTVRLGVVSTCG